MKAKLSFLRIEQWEYIVYLKSSIGKFSAKSSSEEDATIKVLKKYVTELEEKNAALISDKDSAGFIEY